MKNIGGPVPISIELESEDESDLPDFSAFKMMRDGSRSLSAKVKSVEEKYSELAEAIAAPRSRLSDAQARCVYIFWSFICVIFSHRIAKLRLEIQQATDDLHRRGYVFPTSTGRTERMFQC